MNTANLIPINTRPLEEQARLRSKGGKASGETRRRLREEIDRLELENKAYRQALTEALKFNREIADKLLQEKRKPYK